jgi:hypothetical protein
VNLVKKPALPREQRLCQFCKNYQIEDEFHFILKCEKYSNLRTTFFSAIDFIDTSHLNDEELFTFIMSFNKRDTEVINQVLYYVNSAFQLRFPSSFLTLKTLIKIKINLLRLQPCPYTMSTYVIYSVNKVMGIW